MHIFCPICGKKNKFVNNKIGYLKYCSLKCAYNSSDRSNNCLRTKLNTIDKNGLNIIQKSIKKGRQTNLIKYGVDNPFKSKDPKLNGRATKQEKYGDPYYTNRDKAWKTCYKNNGVRCILELKEVHNKGIEKARAKMSRDKARNTHNKHYGVSYPFQRLDYYKNLFNKLWGVDNYSKTKEFKDLWKDKDFVLNFTNKVFNTKKKNKTLGTSNDENIIYQFLIDKFDFDDIIHHYKNKYYPFECDFYIKSLDLFIELNFFWTHGFEPFDKNNKKHLEILEKWKKKSKETNFKQNKKDAYKNAIYIWTIDDPRKLQTFKQNNLNYKIFYNLDEFLDWFETI